MAMGLFEQPLPAGSATSPIHRRQVRHATATAPLLNVVAAEHRKAAPDVTSGLPKSLRVRNAGRLAMPVGGSKHMYSQQDAQHDVS